MKILNTTVLAIAGLACAAAVTYWLNYESWVTLPRARALIADKLRDPSSAQFRNERFTASGNLCGELNSKNGAGGYVGFRRFISMGPDANYLEAEGPIGEWSHADFMLRMDKKIELIKMHTKWRGEGIDIPEFSERELDEMVVKRFFEDKWRELCEVRGS
jgi:hypothetical protein